MLAKSALKSVRQAIRGYMSIAPDDPVDVAVLAAIVANFAPDRMNPLWFVLVASPESGKSMMLDMILNEWAPAWPMATTLSPGYFFSDRTGTGALAEIDAEKKRVLYMRDMAALVSMPQSFKQLIHNQIIAIYDGEYRHQTGNRSKLLLHKRTTRERLGWIGAATEAFYDRVLKHTFALGSRFTPFYWEPRRRHWTDHRHLAEQRDLRAKSVGQMAVARAATQSFLEDAIELMPRFYPEVKMPRASGQRIDAAVTLVMRIAGGDYAPPGGRTADRAAQFARAAAYISGDDSVTRQHTDLGIRLVLSQMSPRYQRLLAYAVRPENLRKAWLFRDFLREVGGRRSVYTDARHGGPIEDLVDKGIFDLAKGGLVNHMRIKITPEALKLVAAVDPSTAELRREVMAEESDASVAGSVPNASTEESGEESSSENIGEIDFSQLDG